MILQLSRELHRSYQIQEFVKMLMVTAEFQMIVSSNHTLGGYQLKNSIKI
jgi:hypothetical protein